MYAVTVVQRMGAQMVRAQAHRRWGHWRNGVDPTVDHFADCLEPSVFSKRIPASLIAAAHCMVKSISWMRTAQPVQAARGNHTQGDHSPHYSTVHEECFPRPHIHPVGCLPDAQLFGPPSTHSRLSSAVVDGGAEGGAQVRQRRLL